LRDDADENPGKASEANPKGIAVKFTDKLNPRYDVLTVS
jgi:hypothetical protein